MLCSIFVCVEQLCLWYMHSQYTYILWCMLCFDSCSCNFHVYKCARMLPWVVTHCDVKQCIFTSFWLTQSVCDALSHTLIHEQCDCACFCVQKCNCIMNVIWCQFVVLSTFVALQSHVCCQNTKFSHKYFMWFTKRYSRYTNLHLSSHHSCYSYITQYIAVYHILHNCYLFICFALFFFLC